MYAFTEPGEPHFASGKKLPDGKLSLSDFAALGIRGLSTRNAVRKYRQVWEDAIAGG